eukprot:NODE_347_length_10448_cov_0.163687.p7 type:complete len:171 gc:universal NODE_347_length_10448_cov_0.163687:8543-8031(-)
MLKSYTLPFFQFESLKRRRFGKIAWYKQEPMQVICAWNGMVSLDIEPFLNGLKFRRGSNEPGMRTPGECSTSECTTLCLDLYKLGYNILLVPQVKVAYQFSVFKSMRIDESRFRKMYPEKMPDDEQTDMKIKWRAYPSSFRCEPYFSKDHGWHPHMYAEYWEDMPATLDE